jgi:predicted Zn finger-like uncharacterized protein
MPEVVTCPQCERQLRVPDELVGQRVKCPTCGTNFTANVSAGPPISAEDEAGHQPAHPHEAYQGEERPRQRVSDEFEDQAYDESGAPRRSERKQRALNSLKAPAILLIVTGVLGILVNIFQIGFVALAKPAPPPPVVANGVKPNPMDDLLREIQKNQAGPLPIVLGVVFLVISSIVVLGGIAMLRGRGYGLSTAGTILAMVNLGNCCCILGLPFGIWSLVVLLNEDVKNAFE